MSAEKKSGLYAARRRIHPASVRDRFRTLKTALAWLLLSAYFVGPWLRWPRGGGAPDQAVLIDMPNRKGWVFGVEIWPQDIHLLTGLLFVGAIAIFAAASLAGRAWCGFTCPQTVWTDLFLWIERTVEGDANARVRLDAAPWSARKVLRRGAKHAAWLLVAAATAATWVFYFVDAPTALGQFLTLSAGPWMWAFLGIVTAATYLLAGWAREHVCVYMCPWSRFQAAMVDEDSLVVSYDAFRGEPRGRRRPGTEAGLGDCVDCGLCVRVCPTGTDIRLGSQLSCIGCGLCADACDGVMDRLGRPRGLVAYDSLANLEAERRGEPRTSHLLRPRPAVYAALLAVGTAAVGAALLARPAESLAALQERSPLFVRLSDGAVRNAYTVRIVNRRAEPRAFDLRADGAGAAALSVIGGDGPRVTVAPRSAESFRVLVTVPAGAAPPRSVTLAARAADGAEAAVAAPFSAPDR